jgi:hypothetical protein
MAKQLTVGNDSTSTTITLKNKSTIGTVYCVQVTNLDDGATETITIDGATISLNQWYTFCDYNHEIELKVSSKATVTVIVAQANLVAAGSTASTAATQS